MTRWDAQTSAWRMALVGVGMAALAMSGCAGLSPAVPGDYRGPDAGQAMLKLEAQTAVFSRYVLKVRAVDTVTAEGPTRSKAWPGPTQFVHHVARGDVSASAGFEAMQVLHLPPGEYEIHDFEVQAPSRADEHPVCYSARQPWHIRFTVRARQTVDLGRLEARPLWGHAVLGFEAPLLGVSFLWHPTQNSDLTPIRRHVLEASSQPGAQVAGKHRHPSPVFTQPERPRNARIDRRNLIRSCSLPSAKRRGEA